MIPYQQRGFELCQLVLGLVRSPSNTRYSPDDTRTQEGDSTVCYPFDHTIAVLQPYLVTVS